MILFLASGIAQVGINKDNSPPDPSSMLDVKSTEKGLLPPRLNTSQRDQITTPASGLVIFNTDCNTLQYYNGGGWVAVGNTIAAPVAGIQVPGYLQIVWNWNPVTGATGYKWNTVNDYNSATDIGTLTTTTETGLTCGTFLIRYVWAYSACGFSNATILCQATLTCFPCGQTLTDPRDGQAYPTVLIGSQCWFAKNLNIGTQIKAVQDQTDNGILEKYCYDSLVSNCDIYGGLYQWNEMMQYVTTEGAQGICPDGWHLPTDDEWSTLLSFLGGTDVAGGKMKEAGTSHWNSPNTGATNSSGFTALPGGYEYYVGYFNGVLNFAYFWSSTPYNSAAAWNCNLHYNDGSVNPINEAKTFGFSCRCLRD